MNRLILSFFLIFLSFKSIVAHELNPARLIINETELNSYQVNWRFPSNVLTKPGSVVFPENCKETINSFPKIEGKYQVQSSSLLCKLDLRNQEITVKGLTRMTDGLITIEFSDGGKFKLKENALKHFHKMKRDGADIIDIGGESTRPGANKVSVDEELKRVLPLLKNISSLKRKVSISLDTRKPEVMSKGIRMGVNLINDVSGLRYSKKTIPFLKKSKTPIVIMHSISNPKLMQKRINYKNILFDIYDFLEKKIIECEKNNIDRSQIIIDPGIGFGKNLQQNLKLIKNISLFHSLGVCILLGVSRKTFIGKISKNALENKRLGGSISAVLFSLNQGVQIFRVHDVMETVQAIDVYSQIRKTK